MLRRVTSPLTSLASRAKGHSSSSCVGATVTETNNLINTPTFYIADPSTHESWKYPLGIDIKPKRCASEILDMSKAADPFQFVDRDLSPISSGIKDILGSDHPVLQLCASYFFDIDKGKKVRPAMVLGMAYALNAQETTGSDQEFYATASQKRLAEIVEMIHTASLFHDDVIDEADTRRGIPSVNQVYGNKIAILGGDFLLARASISLARLRNVQVVELISTIIEHLVKGEIMQMKPSNGGYSVMEYYLRKNFYKTASLMGQSCLSAAVLGEYSEANQKASYLYGVHVGQAFQLIDDVLDFEGSTLSLGKVPFADLKSGLATAPTLFAVREHPKLTELIDRKFREPGDVEWAVGMVKDSEGLRASKALAQFHVEAAIEALEKGIAPSLARDCLISLACKVITRTT